MSTALVEQPAARPLISEGACRSRKAHDRPGRTSRRRGAARARCPGTARRDRRARFSVTAWVPTSSDSLQDDR
ncbi:hypothetical protein ACFPM0_35440 [Pseudonocardia sulfidoxydans]|uniref:hypothetical protein n=1 Tax=Pseudonocardia sulfidoxydans TaxID=54011 RepID=UPI003611BE8F